MITSILQETLEQASSTFDLAQRLGGLCLSDEGHLARLLTDTQVREHCDQLEALVGQISEDAWKRYRHEGFGELLDREGLAELARLVALQHPVEALGFLRGLCAIELEREWASTYDRVVLDYGAPVRFAIRAINKIYERCTPYQLTSGAVGLLADLPYDLFRYKRSDAITVALDHAERDRLDELTWGAHDRLPKIATIHPTLRDQDVEFTATEDTFFDVRPRQWDERAVLKVLGAARGREIAVLPELSLPAPDALERALASAPGRYPPIVVAGSAHARRGRGAVEVRVNESRTYLDGRLVTTSCKVHPYAFKSEGRRLVEAITGGPKEIVILSGKYTRLAVVICADLINNVIPNLLVAAGVNLLLVPSRTTDEGSFNGNVCNQAARCQAVCAVVNPRLDEASESAQAPFHALAAVPRPAQDGQSERYRDPSGRAISRGTIDPNKPLAHAMSWA